VKIRKLEEVIISFNHTNQSYKNILLTRARGDENKVSNKRLLIVKAKKMGRNLRDFEVPVSGGLYLTQFSDELTEFYEPDKEVLIFRN